jgi:predicted CopG family antitoxin
MCIYSMSTNVQSRYTTIRVDLEVYNAILSTKKILEQAYNRKFSLSETIQVVNRLSSDTIQKISSARRDLDEMLVGRGKISAKDIEHAIKQTDRVSRPVQ